MFSFCKVSSVLLGLILSSAVPTSADQENISYISEKLSVLVSPVDNTSKDTIGYVPITLQLTNTGEKPITQGRWKIYFNIMYGVRRATMDCGFHLGHVNGLLYYIKPLDSFKLPSGTSVKCVFFMKGHGSARSDFMPNWYVSEDDAVPRVMKSTAGESLSFVNGFTSNRTWKADMTDIYDPFTPVERFRMNANPLIQSSPVMGVVPTPKQFDIENDQFVIIDKEWSIVDMKELETEADVLNDVLKLNVTNDKRQNNIIQIELGNSDLLNKDLSDNKDGYILDVSLNKVYIAALSPAGVFYGVQTLLKLLRANDSTWTVPIVHVNDSPRFSYRSFFIDIARNFHGKKDILKILNVMATYKMNKLHMHLTDDEGWRVEIPSLPELTRVGSSRCHQSGMATNCLIPSLGSGPFTNTSGSGFYTVEDFRDILRFAKARHIDVIPEIDVPGHSRAAIVSMENRYRSCDEGTPMACLGTDVRLEDSCVASNQNQCGSAEFDQRWRASTIVPCLPSSYNFIRTVLNDLKIIYADVVDLKMVHLGGDEVVFAEWINSASCRVGAGNISRTDLHWKFTQEVRKIAKDLKLDIGVWEEAMYKVMGNNSAKMRTDGIYVHPWNNVWEWGSGANSVKFANAGFKVIMNPATHMYFGHTQEPDPEEPGVYWASRFIDTKKTFSFNAHDIYKNIETTTFGQPLDRSQFCSENQCPRLQKNENVIGIQACLWSETTRTSTRLDYMIFPRILAVAERAWHEAAWERIENVQDRKEKLDEDWARFVSKLGYNELPGLEQKGVKYRVPPPGVNIENGLVKVNTLYPNHNVEMSYDKVTWAPVNDNQKVVQQTVYFRSISPLLHRPSRIVSVPGIIVSNSVKLKTDTIGLIMYCVLLWTFNIVLCQ